MTPDPAQQRFERGQRVKREIVDMPGEGYVMSDQKHVPDVVSVLWDSGCDTGTTTRIVTTDLRPAPVVKKLTAVPDVA